MPDRKESIPWKSFIAKLIICPLLQVRLKSELSYFCRNSGGSEFPVWAKNVIVVNHLLIVLNSSLNFAIYCKDLVFRQTVRKVYGAIFKKKGASSSFAGGGGGGGEQRRAGNVS